jgi:hypothetical protein
MLVHGLLIRAASANVFDLFLLLCSENGCVVRALKGLADRH